MNRNLPISNRISVDVQQLFEDLIVVKCNVNNKEFQGILLNTSKSFFGINESRLKSGPESLTVKELDKGNVSFSCSVERYSYKLDGTGPSIFTRHPVKRHKSPPVSGKHIICQKCQSVVTIPDQVDERKQTGDKDEGRDDLYEVSGSRNRRKSQSIPKRNSNFDTRENYENNHFINYKPKIEEKGSLGSPIFEIGSNITKITPSAGLLDVKKILKKKKKRDRLKDRLKESESETKSSKLEEAKERVKKRKLENQNERAPIKKCKLLEIPYHSSNERSSAEKSGKVFKHIPETLTKEIYAQSKEVPLIKETFRKIKEPPHTKDNIKVSKKADTSQESGRSQTDITHSMKLSSKKADSTESRETREVLRVQAETIISDQSSKSRHSLTDRCSRDGIKQISSKETEVRAQAKEPNISPKESEKSSKKTKKDILMDKKLKKKKKSDKIEVSKSEMKELLKASSSAIGSINGEPSTTRRAKLEAKYRTSKTSVDEVSSASSESVSGTENNQHSKEKSEVDANKETLNLRERRVEKSAVGALEKFMKSSYAENECYQKTSGTDEHEVTSVSADEASGNLDSSDSQLKRKGIDAPPDSSLSLKIKINRTPSSDNGGYKCRIVSDESQTVSSSTTDALQTYEAVSDALFPLSATSTDQESAEVNLTGASTSSSVPVEPIEPMETSSSAAEETFVEQCTLLSGNTFTVGDVVWAKITGYPWWPSRINCIRQAERNESNERTVNYTAEVLWFNWDQISFIPCEKLFHFLDYYKAKCDKKRKGTYRSAVEQAWMAANTAQLIAEGDDDSVESDTNAELKLHSDGASLSHVSSSSTSVVRNKSAAEPNSTNTSDASFSAPFMSVSSTSKGKSLRDSSVSLSSRADPTATSSHESRRRESTDDDSESGLVIDTELSGQGSV